MAAIDHYHHRFSCHCHRRHRHRHHNHQCFSSSHESPLFRRLPYTIRHLTVILHHVFNPSCARAHQRHYYHTHHPPILRHQLTIIYHPPSIIHHLLSIIRHLRPNLPALRGRKRARNSLSICAHPRTSVNIRKHP